MRRSSEVWNHFSLVTADTAKCCYCSAVISARKGSSSSLLRHFRSKHVTIPYLRNENVGTVVVATAPSEVSTELSAVSTAPSPVSTTPRDKTKNLLKLKKKLPKPEENLLQPTNNLEQLKAIDDQLIKMITKGGYPFSFVSEPEFKKLMNLLCPTYKVPSKQMIRDSLIPKHYNEVLNSVRNRVLEARAICLTTDGWTSQTNDSFITITAHWVDAGFQLVSAMLSCVPCNERLTVVNLKELLTVEIEKWGVEDKIVCIVSNNAANMKAAVSLGGWRHHTCFAHTINLVAQSAVKQISEAVNEVKKIVTFFKRSTVATEELEKHQQEKGVEGLKLKQDYVTRWNSTFFMLKSFLKLKEAVMSTLVSLNSVDVPDLPAPRTVRVIEASMKFLQPLFEVTKEMEDENNVSVSKILPILKLLRIQIENLMVHPNFVDEPHEIKQLASELYSGLSKHHEIYEQNRVLGDASLLDPRFKKLAFWDGAKAAVAVTRLKNKANSIQPTETQPVHNFPSTSSSLWTKFDEEVEELKGSENKFAQAVIEVDKYLSEPMLDRHEDPVKWWRERKEIYPNLIKLVERRLCVVATSVPCERIFSKTGQIMTDRRSRIKSTAVEKVIFLQHNL